jgi:PIN domain nuclease of toxin-antitoxin system
MAEIYVLDTHALLWFVQGDQRLGARAAMVLADPLSNLRIPVIALAEACWIVEHGRTKIASVEDLLDAVDRDPRQAPVSFSREILNFGLGLLSIREMHDRQIVATALYLQAQGHQVTLRTRDENITAAGVVPVAW